MKRLTDYDEYTQGIPRNKPVTAGLTSGGRNPLYVTVKEFNDMQTKLEQKLAEQVTILEKALEELKMIKLHLASMSGETIEETDEVD